MNSGSEITFPEKTDHGFPPIVTNLGQVMSLCTYVPMYPGGGAVAGPLLTLHSELLTQYKGKQWSGVRKR